MSEPRKTETEPGFGEIRAGNLGVRLAVNQAEIDAVQALRFRVFYQEMGARPDTATASSHRDRDDFDAVADHLLVVDHDRGEGPESVVGTYRLIRRHAAEALGRWYSEAEYDVSRLVAYPGPVLEWADPALMPPIAAAARCNYCGMASQLTCFSMKSR